MFKIPPYFIRFIDEPADTGGGSESAGESYNLGVPDDYGQSDNSQDSSQQVQSEVKDNPAWNTVYEKLPKEFHEIIRPDLKSWDDNFAKVQTQYAPYKPLLEQGIPYEAVQTSLDFARLLNANPRAVYDELGQRFGFSVQGQQQVEEQNPNEQEAPEEGVFEPQDLSKNPQFAQLQDAYKQLEQRLVQEDQQKRAWQEEQAAVREINSEWQSIEAKTGALPQEIKAEIIRRSIFIADQKGPGAVPLLSEGYADYANFVTRIRNSRANNTAPDVMPGNGGLPVAKKSYGQMDEEEFVDRIAEMAKALAEGNQ